MTIISRCTRNAMQNKRQYLLTLKWTFVFTILTFNNVKNGLTCTPLRPLPRDTITECYLGHNTRLMYLIQSQNVVILVNLKKTWSRKKIIIEHDIFIFSKIDNKHSSRVIFIYCIIASNYIICTK